MVKLWQINGVYMRELTVAAIQMAMETDRAANIAKAKGLVRRAAGLGARLILLPELFETPYFCKEIEPSLLMLASRPQDNPAIRSMRVLAAELQIRQPIGEWLKAEGEVAEVPGVW